MVGRKREESGGGEEGGNHALDGRQVPITAELNINGVKCTVVHSRNVGSAAKVQNLSLKRREVAADDEGKIVKDKHRLDDEDHARAQQEKLVKEPKTKRKKRKSELKKHVKDKHEPDDENHGREDKLVKEPKTKRKKRKSEVEKLLEDKIEISPGERRAAAKKDKYYTATEEDMIAAVSYTNIVSAFKDGEDPSLHREEFYDMPGSVSNTAVSCPNVWSGITQPEGGGHTVGTEDGGGIYGASLEVSQGSGEHVSCKNIFCDHDYSIYLL